jgi:putative transposase
MPRRSLAEAGGVIFHVLNRSVRRERLFFTDADYAAFERVLAEALVRIPIRLLAYCVMPNHWHLVIWPHSNEIPRFMHWLTMTHAKRWHRAHGSEGLGHVYQNRYTAVPVQNDHHLITLLRYVERNALRANLVQRAQEWRWCSLWKRCNSCDQVPLAQWPFLQPDDWLELVNRPEASVDLQKIRLAVHSGEPLGDQSWKSDMARRLEISLRRRGRPSERHRV